MTRTELVERTLLQALQGENAGELISSLTQTEQELFYQLLEIYRNEGDSNMIDELWRVDYIKRPPSIDEFINDDYWLGKTMRPSEENSGIFPVWRECLERDFDLDSRVHNLVVTGSLGIGKCFAPGTLIMRPDGSYSKVEELSLGDRVMGDDSTPRKITQTTSGVDQMYEIVPLRPKNGPTFTCNGAHILCLKDKDGSVVEVSVDEYLQKNYAKHRPGLKLYRVPIKFKSKKVELDPYWLGLWIGDGSSDGPHITIADDEVEYLLEVHEKVCAQHSTRVHVYPNSGCKLYASSKTTKLNNLLHKLRKYGLAVERNTKKFIPGDYLRNSVEVRKALLAGIIDSDGGKYCEGCYGIGFASKTLADQTTELARSLGYMCACSFRHVKDQRGHQFGCWTVVVSGANDIPVRIPWKQSVKRSKLNRRSTDRTGFKIVPKGLGKYYGFELDGNRRFIINGNYVSHNSWCSCAIFLYRLALASLLRNPQNFLGLSKGSSVVYSILSVSKGVVAETVFGDTQNFMSHSAFFLEECHFNPNSKYSNYRIELPNDMMITAGSKGQHVIGRNTLGVMLDEGNWRLEADPDTKAYKLYDEVRTRLKNRFQKTAGFLPAISILSSSARDESSFTESIIKDIETANDEKSEKVYRFAVYRARRHLLKLKPRWFKVTHGLKNVDPQLLSGWYTEAGVPIKDAGAPHEEPPPGVRVELVPEDYHDAFMRNTRVALQSVCGISTGGSHLLFPSTVDVERCIELAEKDGVQNPSRAEFLSISQEDDREIWDFLDHSKFLTRRYSEVVPLRHPEAKRFGHLDLATQSTAGLAICHLVGNQRVDGLVKDGIVYSEYRLVVEYDFILAIVAGRTKPISFEKIQRFFFWLRQECGFSFGLVTADSFQSEMPLQMMQTRGFEAKVLSMDRKKAPYYSWRTGFEELRIRPYRHRQMLKELERLIDLPDKIDHPPQGSKDVSDACGAAYWNAINYEKDAGSPSGTEPSMHPETAIDTGMSDNLPAIMTIPVPPSGRPNYVFEA